MNPLEVIIILDVYIKRVCEVLEEAKEKTTIQFFNSDHFRINLQKLAVIDKDIAENSDLDQTEYITYLSDERSLLQLA